ncbi:MAG TPA: carboxypeptidase-like regulatory domain-containing protein, partial [Terriglobia bacterium]|nr:carboxypeptidase-like regulatory domain-containing protein [Terriglobia bacterium]
MTMAILTRRAFSILLFLTCATTAWSQGFQGTIRGDVRDPSGALVPGATATVVSVATGERRTQITDDVGIFFFPNLLVGDYTITVELPGFKKYTRENVQVSANNISPVRAELEVGVIQDSIVVTTGEEVVNASTAQLVGVTTRNVVDLPNPVLSGNPNNIAILAPGTTTMPGGVAGHGGSIGGNRPRNNNFVVDGVDNNDPSTTGILTPVIAEAVQEFTLITNQFNAEYGHSTAGQFITTTQSGSNNFHGGAWWYNQNRHTNSLDNLRRAATPEGGEKPRYDWNRFGGRLGGPIMKEKWFFFGAYEYQNKTLDASSSSIIRVPTASGLAALQTLANTAGTGVSPINVGILSQHVPVASVQTGTINVQDQATNTAVPIGVGPLDTLTPNFDRTHLFLGNSDFLIGKHHLSGRYSHSSNKFIVPGTLPVPGFNADADIGTHRIVFSDVFIVG